MKQEALKSFLNLSFPISTDVLWFVLSIVAFVFIIFSLVIFYHWHKFGRQAWAIGLAEVIYLAGSVFFILGAAASIILY